MFTISKRFEFSASHVLDHLPEGHPCGRLHGHNYAVELELAGAGLDDAGFVLDYRALDGFKRYIDDELDHRHLNDVLTAMGVEGNPSAENLARFLCATATGMLTQLTDQSRAWVSAVRVMETPKTVAEYRP